MKGPQAQELISAWPLSAVALMAVNDLWLKPSFHNALTGKLSDVAICFFLPLYLSALLELVTPLGLRARLGTGAAATALVFTALKVSPAAAQAWVALLSTVGRPIGLPDHRAVADPTDLAALPFIALGVLDARRRLLDAPQPIGTNGAKT